MFTFRNKELVYSIVYLFNGRLCGKREVPRKSLVINFYIFICAPLRGRPGRPRRKKTFTVHSKIYGRRSFPLVYFAAVKKYCSSRSIQQLLRSISPQSRCGGGGGGAASARGRGDLSVLHFAASASGLSPAHLRLRSAAACPSPPHYGTPSWIESSFLL